jgi:hypothetical protein
MSLKLQCLATAALIVSTGAAAQTQPTTTQTQPTTTQTQPTTTQTTTTQTQPANPAQPATTQTTTTQTQPATSPTDPATTTTQTTTTQTQPAAGAVTLATPADIKAGALVLDQTGAEVGKVDSVDADGAIVNTGKARAEIPLTSFGKSDKGLVVSVTKADLDSKAETKTDTKTEVKPKSE